MTATRPRCNVHNNAKELTSDTLILTSCEWRDAQLVRKDRASAGQCLQSGCFKKTTRVESLIKFTNKRCFFILPRERTTHRPCFMQKCSGGDDMQHGPAEQARHEDIRGEAHRDARADVRGSRACLTGCRDVSSVGWAKVWQLNKRALRAR